MIEYIFAGIVGFCVGWFGYQFGFSQGKRHMARQCLRLREDFLALRAACDELGIDVEEERP